MPLLIIEIVRISNKNPLKPFSIIPGRFGTQQTETTKGLGISHFARPRGGGGDGLWAAGPGGRRGAGGRAVTEERAGRATTCTMAGLLAPVRILTTLLLLRGGCWRVGLVQGFLYY